MAGTAQAGVALAATQHDVVLASAAQLPVLGTDHRGLVPILEFAQYDTRLDKTGIDTRLDKADMDTRLDKTDIDTRLDTNDIDTRLDTNDIDNPANANRQALPVGGEVVSAPPAPASGISGSSGVTIITAPAEGAAIESDTGPKVSRAPVATQQ